MDEDLKYFFDIMVDKSALPSPELVEALAEKYPFFALPAATLLNRGGAALDTDTRKRMGLMVALNSADHTMLARFTSEYGDLLSDFYPHDENTTPQTDDAITMFLNRYGTQSPEEDELLERLIFNPVPDYASQLAAEDEAEVEKEGDDTLAGLLSQINNPHEKVDENTVPVAEAESSPISASKVEVAPADSSLSESLAKIFIKQHRYDKALEIISNLSLKFPEKSIYFADQMRFLKKLIINSKYNLKNNS